MAGNSASYPVYSTLSELPWIAIVCGETCAGSFNHSQDILNWIFQNCISKYL